jgi:hypothetical protein
MRMDFTQRSTIPQETDATGRLWAAYPEDEAPAARPEGEPDIPQPLPTDHYVTVDERVEGVAGLVAAAWPTIDAAGLLFGDLVEASWFDLAELQARVDQLRAANGDQLARPLRIGDSFWVRGYDPDSLARWMELRDITAEAREMAKTAVAVVAVGVIDEAPYVEAELEAAEAGETGDQVEQSSRDLPPPPGPQTASPVI